MGGQTLVNGGTKTQVPPLVFTLDQFSFQPSQSSLSQLQITTDVEANGQFESYEYVKNDYVVDYYNFSIDLDVYFYIDQIFQDSDLNINLISDIWAFISNETSDVMLSFDDVLIYRYYQTLYSNEERRLLELSNSQFNYFLNVSMSINFTNFEYLMLGFNFYENIFEDQVSFQSFQDLFQFYASNYTDFDAWKFVEFDVASLRMFSQENDDNPIPDYSNLSRGLLWRISFCAGLVVFLNISL